MTFKNKLSEKYDSVQMEASREKIQEFLMDAIEECAKSGLDKRTITLYMVDILDAKINLKTFETFLSQEEISYRKDKSTESYTLDLTE